MSGIIGEAGSKSGVIDEGHRTVLLEKFTASGHANKDFDLSSYKTYNEYKFVFNNVLPSSNGQDFEGFLGTSGSSFSSGTDDYRVAIARWYFGGSGNALTRVDNSMHNKFLNASSVNASTNYAGVSGSMSLYHPLSASRFTGVNLHYSSWTSNDYIYHYSGGGWIRAAAINTHVRFQYGSGNITLGSIMMYGVKDV